MERAHDDPRRERRLQTVAESLAVGEDEIAAAGGTLRIVQKFGTVLSNIDTRACARAGIKLLTLRRRANISCAEHALGLMLALARKIHETAGLVSVAQLEAAGYSPTRYDRTHTANRRVRRTCRQQERQRKRF